MFIFIFIIIILIPFCSLFFLIKPLNAIFVMGNNSFELMNNIDATNFYASLKNVKKNIRKSLINNGVGEEKSGIIADNVVKVIKRLIIYILTGVMYFIITISLIINVFHKFIIFIPNGIQEQLGLIIGFGMTFSILYAPPLLEYFGYQKLKETILDSFDQMFRLIDRLSNYSVYMFGELIGFFVLLLYIYYVNRFNFMKVNVILHNVIYIGIYQLIINKYVLSRVFIRFDKYRFKNITLERSCKIHKNSNYMNMVIITMFSYINNIYDSKILYALTLLFLFDTYIGNRKELLIEEKNFN